MNKSLNKQVYGELNKTYRALHWDLKAGRRNPYKDLLVSDVKDLNKFYKALDKKDYKKALALYNRLDTAVRDEVPRRIWMFMDYVITGI